jgi:hypothetical protein
MALDQQWGIFDQNGGPVFLADSVFSVEYMNTYRVSDYPIEEGSFASYNKVKVPTQTKITFLTGGDINNRSNFLESLEAAIQALDLFVVVTPEISYDNTNLTFFTYRRTAKAGVQLLMVEVWCEEIRIIQQGNLSNTQSTNGADTQQNGAVQPLSTGTNGSPNLAAGLSPPSSGTSTPPASLENPNIGPAFYTANNLPEVPNTWNGLNANQQQSTINLGQTLNSTNASAYPTDNSGNTVTTFSDQSFLIAPGQ